MTDNDLRAERWGQFSMAEQALLDVALASILQQTQERDLSDSTPDERLEVAGTLLVAGRMLLGLSEHKGDPHPTYDTLLAIAADMTFPGDAGTEAAA